MNLDRRRITLLPAMSPRPCSEAVKSRNTLDELNSSCFLIHQHPQFLPKEFINQCSPKKQLNVPGGWADKCCPAVCCLVFFNSKLIQRI